MHEIIKFIEQVEDGRNNVQSHYPLEEILLLTISGIASGCNDWQSIIDFGEMKLEWLRKYYSYENGICSHDTLNRVFGLLNYRKLERLFINWVSQGLELSNGMIINIDGKSLRRSASKQELQTPFSKGGKHAVHLVQAWCSEIQICLGQYKTEGKVNEIDAIENLLNLLELEGTIVSIDAMGCQRAFAEQLKKEKNADYILAVKGNQKSLQQAIIRAFEDQDEFEQEIEVNDRDHGRIEKRISRVLSAEVLDQELRKKWFGLSKIIEIESHREIISTKKKSIEKRIYISSITDINLNFNDLVRSHWAIENELHWVLDVAFKEDASTKRVKNTAQNFGLFLRLVRNKIKLNKEKISIKNKRMRCALSDQYREITLFN